MLVISDHPKRLHIYLFISDVNKTNFHCMILVTGRPKTPHTCIGLIPELYLIAYNRIRKQSLLSRDSRLGQEERLSAWLSCALLPEPSYPSRVEIISVN